uniref:FAS1 domain-containing protein n=1 Tax=Glossina morsitans morsitans TaxID=37546 RepID=A0ABK9NFV2_GLOMM
MNDVDVDFFTKVINSNDYTLMVPKEENWDESGFNNLEDADKMDIIKMHILRGRVTRDTIVDAIENKTAQFPTLSPQTRLYFEKSGRSITVQGRSVNASIITTDRSAQVLFHEIDKVLGITDSTVVFIMKTDKTLNKSNTLGAMSFFNDQLGAADRNFTYFVPSDVAWNTAENLFSDVVSKLYMPEFALHTHYLLERHLIVSDKKYSMKELAEWNETRQLPTLRGSLSFKVVEEIKDYYLLWRTKRILVYRPDVECTNGYIHVIDDPLMDRTDFLRTFSCAVLFDHHFNHILLMILPLIKFFSLI